ncbi:MAG: pilus assembly protein [Ostreibacterium sp.]
MKIRNFIFTVALVQPILNPALSQSVKVGIAPIIESGTTTTTTQSAKHSEVAPNIWFLLDDSGSMESGIAYDPKTIYVIPTDEDGKPRPSIKNNLCDDQNNVANCNVWSNFYSTRMLTLKAALSNTFLKDSPSAKENNIRVGYTTINAWQQNHKNIFPVKPFSSGSKGKANRKAMKQWVYSLTADGNTQTRVFMSRLYAEIYNNAHAPVTAGAKTNNIFIDNPAQPYDSKNNTLLACRRNYVVLLTDGQWADSYSQNANVNKVLADAGFPQTGTIATNHLVTTEGSYTLPDGKQYKPMAPYRKQPYLVAPTVRSLGDMAFLGWITDIDNDKSNNQLGPKYVKVLGKIQKLNGSSYWHPYNDEANWQHINTFTIGVGVKDLKTPSGVVGSVNPPVKGTTNGGISPDYLSSNFSWKIDINNGFMLPATSIAQSLANIAVNGRGRYYKVKNSQDMQHAFTSILANIQSGGIGGTTTAPSPSIKGSSGASSNTQSTGDAYYSTRYDLKHFTGNMLRYNIYDGNLPANQCFSNGIQNHKIGDICDIRAWDAVDLLNKNTKRKIVSMKRMNKTSDLSKSDSARNVSLANLGYQQIDFTVAKLTQRLKSRMVKNFPKIIKSHFKSNKKRLQELVAYIKGSDIQEKAGIFRKRLYSEDSGKTTKRSILGAIVRSSPAFAGVPEVNSKHPDKTSVDYINFVKRYLYNKDNNGNYVNACTKSAKCAGAAIPMPLTEMIYVGANDGMLHAFKSSDGKEVFAYVPNAVYDNLPLLTKDSQRISLVDGNIAISTVDINNNQSVTWKQILVGTMGGGAKGLYALDVTNPADTGKIAKWEYSDLESLMYQKAKGSRTKLANLKSNVGNIMAKPTIAQLKDKTWVAITGNGYNAKSNRAALIVIDLDTGKPIQELVLDNSYTDRKLPNGLGPVSVISYDGKSAATANYADRAYAGDLQGNLWVFDLTNATKNGGITVAKKRPADSDRPLFVARSPAQEVQPITVAPLIKMHHSNYGYLVHFGTGSLFSKDDLSSNITNSTYAIWDDWVPTANGGLPVPRAGNVVKRSHLKEVHFRKLAGSTVQTADNKSSVVARLLDDATMKKPIDWAFTGNNFSTNKRGWSVDLLEGERAWQPAYITHGANDVEGVAYKTVIYQLGSSSVTSPSTPSTSVASSCTTSGDTSTSTSTAQTYSMSFNPDDGTQTLADNGTIDANGDGKITQEDQVLASTGGIIGGIGGIGIGIGGIGSGGTSATLASGLLNTGIGFNPVALTSHHKKPINGNKANGCKGSASRIILGSNATSASVSSTRVCLSAFTGSWKQLR